MNKFFQNKSAAFSVVLIIVVGLIFAISLNIKKNQIQQVTQNSKSSVAQILNPLSIKAMREKTYTGSSLVIEQTLTPGSNYNQYIASYISDGLKIYGLLTVPTASKPKGGFPAIIFNHGYIQPDQYRTTERYVAYVDAFARNGYVVFKSDYRGNGDSQGDSQGAYYSPSYATDVLNALSSVKKYKDVNPDKIGMWGHSMGGNITLRSLVVDTKDIKVAVIWGGVVGNYNDLLNNWQRKVTYQPSAIDMGLRISGRQKLTNQFGTPIQDPQFWNSIDPTYFLSDINAPIQLDVGGADEEVPTAFSQELYDKLKQAGKSVEIYVYPGADHNISQSLNLALQRSIDFFNKYLKGGE